ncbi:MAG: glycosyltransferase family 2 protein [Pelagimonas sp.]
MRIFLHIGPDAHATDRLQRVLDSKRDILTQNGVLYPTAPGPRNHTRLYLACSDPDNIDSIRFHRGVISGDRQNILAERVLTQLKTEIQDTAPDSLILTAPQFGNGLASPTELARLQALLAQISTDIRIVAHIDDPARMLVKRYALQTTQGRAETLDVELNCLSGSFWDRALASTPAADPASGFFPDLQGANFWIDFKRLEQEWSAAFGPGSVVFRSLDPNHIWSPHATDELRDSFDPDFPLGPAEEARLPKLPSEAWVARCRQFNDVVVRMLAGEKMILERPLWRKLLQELRIGGRPIDAGGLGKLSSFFANDIVDLCQRHGGLNPDLMRANAQIEDWTEADTRNGFRATQYLLAFKWRINQAARETLSQQGQDDTTEHAPNQPDVPDNLTLETVDAALSPVAQKALPAVAKASFIKLQNSPFAPHNRMGHVNETVLAPDFPPRKPRKLDEGSSGHVIVGCMKNEAPYILEWVAYHRAIGFDNFLIYTNNCEDGTSEMLDRLQALGILEHRNNDEWSGNSPQQYALDQALNEPVVKHAKWIAHIDVDEFINIRCGTGTLEDLFAKAPDATNIAMTWRLFGHNGVAKFTDQLVIDQFDSCAPKYCPKPHTVWGFKTLFRNKGAYGKISCHRPNKLTDGSEAHVKWINGSGEDMTKEAINNGWRSSRKTIGYDLVQLNHYALRSSESYLIKRQRGRALHVNRNIGLHYWIRMDWSVHRDLTIKRNIPRVQAELDHLKSDPEIAKLHTQAVQWHQNKALELHKLPEFEKLYQQALQLKITATERVALSIVLDTKN